MDKREGNDMNDLRWKMNDSDTGQPYNICKLKKAWFRISTTHEQWYALSYHTDGDWLAMGKFETLKEAQDQAWLTLLVS
jgi:hypothetical protein